MNNVRFWTEGVPVEHEALNQIRNIAALPIVAGHLAIMPDVHLGKGATVGSVIPTRGAIIPAAVGVDIGCGMCAVKTTLTAADLPDTLARLRSAIEAMVPVGFNAHKLPMAPMKTSHGGLQGIALHRRMGDLHERFAKVRILDRVGKYDAPRVWKQLGTLPSFNHARSRSGKCVCCLTAISRAMWMAVSPMVLPTLREPECSITHTACVSSRQTSIK